MSHAISGLTAQIQTLAEQQQQNGKQNKRPNEDILKLKKKEIGQLPRHKQHGCNMAVLAAKKRTAVTEL